MKLLIIILLLLLALGALIYAFQTPNPFLAYNHIQNFSKEAQGNPNRLRTMTWNIAWAYGLGSEGEDYTPKSEEEIMQNLDSIADLIKDFNPDIVFLQEVDFASSKSYGVDQLKYLSEKTGLNRAYAVSWNHRYLPFPYWPIHNHFGKVVSGGGILSRFPIKQNQVSLWPKPEGNPWWYNLFYLYRYSQFATVAVGDQDLVVVNSHLEAFDKENRALQAKLLKDKIEKTKNVILSAGDFNTTPDKASKKTNFTNYSEDDYSGVSTYGILKATAGLKDAPTEEEYLKEESRWFSFPSNAPDRKLDYIFYSAQKLRPANLFIQKNSASDHLPLAGEFELLNVDD